MTFTLGFRAAVFTFFGLILSLVVWRQYKADEKSSDPSAPVTGGKVRYAPIVSGTMMPLFLLTLLVIGLIVLGPQLTVRTVLSLCFSIFLQICLYYLLLMPLLPLLRRHFSARVCAALWLLPNLLYILIHSEYALPAPWLVLTLPGGTIWVFFLLWLAGFVTVLLWKTAQHLFFRRRILTGGCPVTDREMLKVWRKECADAGLPYDKLRLLISGQVHTPLTVGLTRRTIRVVLPRRSYTSEELALIFRHELVHIARQDAQNKFFLVFCTAMCWFNPLMWVAMRKSAEDLELSCDETVLLQANDDTRKRYAALLLTTAGEERGYTTCLAASAKALRYRLKGVLHPAKRRCGALLVGLAFFLLCFTCGYVALAYSGTTGAEALCVDAETHLGSGVSLTVEGTSYRQPTPLREEDLLAFLAGLQMTELTGNYTFDTVSGSRFSCFLHTAEGLNHVALYDNALELLKLSEQRGKGRYLYYIAEGVDWAQLQNLMIEPPLLRIGIDHPDNGSMGSSAAHLVQLWRTADGQRTLYCEGSVGNTSSHIPWSDTRRCRFTLEFSETPAAPYRITVQDAGLNELYTAVQDGISPRWSFTPVDQYARYVVTTAYIGADGALYEAEYLFDVGPIG